jgi:transcriptional regulator with GAF, ATPase, and Fis domain
MDWNVWYSCIGSKDFPERCGALQALTRHGIDLSRFDQHVASGPGILFLSANPPELMWRISELSWNGRRRLLVVTDTPEALGDDAWNVLKAGASDVIVWADPAESVGAIAARLGRWRAIDDMLTSPEVRQNLVGVSAAWMRTLRQVVEAAHFSDAPVLLLGETGTGKEQLARLIHAVDAQRNQSEFVVVDCAIIVPELAGSELFGHERGAFTSAIASRDGAFAVADGGTLFLDEVGDLPAVLQPQLLRVVQEQTYKRVGSNTWRHTDFRLISATNRDLFADESSDQFRRDLFYRIAGWVISLPPLRERPDDIVPLVKHFISEMRPDEDPPELCPQVRDHLLTRDYPGNVRDLRRLVARIVCRHVGAGPITIGDIPEDERTHVVGSVERWSERSFDCTVRQALELGAGLREIRRLAEDAAIRAVTLEEQGNLQRAAKRLGVTDRALQQRRANDRQGDTDRHTLAAG